jgi:hypothetical protein
LRLQLFKDDRKAQSFQSLALQLAVQATAQVHAGYYAGRFDIHEKSLLQSSLPSMIKFKCPIFQALENSQTFCQRLLASAGVESSRV